MYKMVWSFIALCGLSLHVAANEIELSISDEIIDLRFAVSYEQDFSGTFALLHADHNDVKSDHNLTPGMLKNQIVYNKS